MVANVPQSSHPKLHFKSNLLFSLQRHSFNTIKGNTDGDNNENSREDNGYNGKGCNANGYNGTKYKGYGFSKLQKQLVLSPQISLQKFFKNTYLHLMYVT